MTVFAPLPEDKFSVILVDPPWSYKGQSQHNGKGKKLTGGAVEHYPTVPTSVLKTLPVSGVCEDKAICFMWVTSPHLDQGIDLMKAWGFKYKTIAFVWDKQKLNPGAYTLSQVEIVIVGIRGSIPKPRGSRRERQFLSEIREEHSRKPEEVRKRINRMFPTQKKLELFARRQAPGWTIWGNEVTMDPPQGEDHHVYEDSNPIASGTQA